MSGEDSGDGQLLQPTDEHAQTTQPFVEVGDNHRRRPGEAGHELYTRESTCKNYKSTVPFILIFLLHKNKV